MVTAGPEQQAQDQTGPCRTLTASPGSEWRLPDLNCKRKIAEVLAGPRTASPGSEWRLPDLNCKRKSAAVLAGPRTASPGSDCKRKIAVVPANPTSKPWIRVITAGPEVQSARSQWSLPDPKNNLQIKVISADLDHKKSTKMYQIECQIEFQKI